MLKILYSVEQLNRCQSLRLVMFVMMVISVNSSASAESLDSSELKFKIIYLYNFSKLTEWSASSFDKDSSPINICIQDDMFFYDAAQSLNSKKVKNRLIKVLAVGSKDQISNCHLIYLSQNVGNQKKHLDQAHQEGVLSVGDHDDFIKKGGVISLLKIDNRIRFEINLSRVNEARFKISSKLLRLAKTVHHLEMTD